MAARRSGRAGGGGVPLSPSRTLLGPGWPAGQLPTCGIAQEKNNAGFGRNEGTLVVLAEPSTQGKVALLQSGSSRRRPVWKGAGRDPSHQRAAIAFDEDTSRGHQRQLEFISAPYRISASTSGPLQAALPQRLLLRLLLDRGTGWKRNAVKLSQEPTRSPLPIRAWSVK